VAVQIHEFDFGSALFKFLQRKNKLQQLSNANIRTVMGCFVELSTKVVGRQKSIIFSIWSWSLLAFSSDFFIAV